MEERAQVVKKAEGEGNAQPAKRGCTQFAKQLQKLEGDVQLVKARHPFVFNPF